MRPVGNQPLYRTLREEIELYIQREQPVLLPTERELMAQYGVSRKTVRSAVAELIRTGRVTPVRGKGTLVNPTVPTAAAPVIILDSYETLPAYEYEIYLAVRQQLDAAGILPSVHLIDPHSPTLAGQLQLIPEHRRILLFSTICNREEAWYYFRRRADAILCLGFRPQQPFSYCCSDLADGFRQLTQLLLERGHRRIALLSLHRDRERGQAFAAAHRAAGIALDPELCLEAAGTRRDGYRAINRLLERNTDFTAVLAHNDRCALGAMEGLLQRGINIPEEVSLAGCDNLVDAQSFPVPLTTAAHQHEIYAGIARAFLSGEPSPTARIIPMSIVNRQSIKECPLCAT
ncbi:MAG: substrate-binding domain-containing protein [Victivallales bacterium]|nr:substrate-binding domain-containing protein [Victivallales bacterium]